MSCERFLERLYDEDARRALLARVDPPSDLRGHLEGCADCRREWEAAANDVSALPRSLMEPAPPHLRVQIGEAMRQQLTPEAALAIDWRAALSWAGAAGAYAAGVLHALDGPASASWYVAAFVLGATLAFAAKMTREGLADSTF